MTVGLWFMFAIWTYICFFVLRFGTVKKADNFQRIMGFLFMMMFWFVAPVITLLEIWKEDGEENENRRRLP